MTHETTLEYLWHWLARAAVRDRFNVGLMTGNRGLLVWGYDFAFYGDRGCTLQVECEGKPLVAITYGAVGPALRYRGPRPLCPQGYTVHAREACQNAAADQRVTVTTFE